MNNFWHSLNKISSLCSKIYTAFNGTDEFFEAGAVTDYSFVQNTAVCTVTFWMKFTDYTEDRLQVVMSTCGIASGNKGFAIWYDNRTVQSSPKYLRMFVPNAGGAGSVIQSLTLDDVIVDNSWHHVAVVMDATNAFFYIDDVKQTGSDTVGVLSTGNNTFAFNAGKANTAAHLFHGDLAHITIWDTNLSDSEITEIHDEGRGTGVDYSGMTNYSANCISHWKLDTLNPVDVKGSINGTSNNMDASNIICG